MLSPGSSKEEEKKKKKQKEDGDSSLEFPPLSLLRHKRHSARKLEPLKNITTKTATVTRPLQQKYEEAFLPEDLSLFTEENTRNVATLSKTNDTIGGNVLLLRPHPSSLPLETTTRLRQPRVAAAAEEKNFHVKFEDTPLPAQELIVPLKLEVNSSSSSLLTQDFIPVGLEVTSSSPLVRTDCTAMNKKEEEESSHCRFNILPGQLRPSLPPHQNTQIGILPSFPLTPSALPPCPGPPPNRHLPPIPSSSSSRRMKNVERKKPRRNNNNNINTTTVIKGFIDNTSSSSTSTRVMEEVVQAADDDHDKENMKEEEQEAQEVQEALEALEALETLLHHNHHTDNNTPNPVLNRNEKEKSILMAFPPSSPSQSSSDIAATDAAAGIAGPSTYPEYRHHYHRYRTPWLPSHPHGPEAYAPKPLNIVKCTSSRDRSGSRGSGAPDPGYYYSASSSSLSPKPLNIVKGSGSGSLCMDSGCSYSSSVPKPLNIVKDGSRGSDSPGCYSDSHGTGFYSYSSSSADMPLYFLPSPTTPNAWKMAMTMPSTWTEILIIRY